MASHQLAGMFLGEMQALRGGPSPSHPLPAPPAPRGAGTHASSASFMHLVPKPGSARSAAKS